VGQECAEGRKADVLVQDIDLGEPDVAQQVLAVTLSTGGIIKLLPFKARPRWEYRKANSNDAAPRIEIPDGRIEPTAVLRRVQAAEMFRLGPPNHTVPE
jgi:hypothetical protein